MNKLITITLLLTLVVLSGCEQVDWALGISPEGTKLPGPAPVDYLTELLGAFGTLGGVVAAGLGVAGTAYVANKKSKDPLKAIVAGIQKAKEELDDEEREYLVDSLKKHIPNKYHATIKKIKDTL